MKRKVLLIATAALMTLLMGTCLAHAADMTYDAATHTYTLNNSTVTEPIALTADSTIIVKGNNYITVSSPSGSTNIPPCIGSKGSDSFYAGYNITIKGGGTLTISSFILAGDFTLTEGTKLVVKGSPGISALGTFTVTDSEIEMTSGSKGFIESTSGNSNHTFTNSKLAVDGMPGIHMNGSGDIVMTNCEVTANGGWIDSYGNLSLIGGKYVIRNLHGTPGIYCPSGKLTIRGADIKTDTFTIAGEIEMTDATYETVDYTITSYAIQAFRTFVISGSTLKLNGDNMSFGIFASTGPTIKDGSDITINSMNGGIGGHTIDISHSCINIKTTSDDGSGALYAYTSSGTSGTITINDAKVNVPARYNIGDSPNGDWVTLVDTSTGAIAKEVSISYEHKWDAGKITKQPTTTAEGVKTYTCTVCGETKTETVPKLPVGEDGTAFGRGASAEVAEAAILALKDDKDPAGTVFGGLQLKAAKTTKNSIKLSWKKVKGAAKYVIYSNACGKGKKYQKLTTVTGKSTTVKKVAGKKLAKGKYYKFLMVAVDANGMVVSTSKTVHAATLGGKVGNPTKVTTKAKKNKVTVKVKKTFKLAAKQAGKKVKKHRVVSYESSNAKVATVSKKGVIKGIKKGTCKVYAYAQNGACAVIKVTVK